MATNLDELLVEELRDLYDSEKQLVKALPKMAKAATSDELREAITEHLEQTKGHVQRIEQAFEHLGVKARSKPCAAMKGLISEGQETIGEDHAEELMDLAIIGAAQRVEHYEIAAYGTARTFAEKLGHQDVVELLQETLDEEKAADEKLTECSEAVMENVQTGGEEDNEDEEGEEEQVTARSPARGKAKRSGGR